MDDHREFAIDDPGATLSDGPPPAPPAPLIVIEYRHRGVPAALVPPALILIAALAIVSYQRQKPFPALEAARIPGLAAPPSATAKRTITVEAPATGAAFEPLAVRSERLLAPAPAVAADAPAVAEPSPIEDRQADGLATRVQGPVDPPTPAAGEEERPAAGVGPLANREAPKGARPNPAGAEGERRIPWAVPVTPGPQPAARPPEAVAIAVPLEGRLDAAPEPEVTKEEVLDGIRREAAQKEAERRKLEALRPQLRAWEFMEMLRKTQENRVPFHNELRALLKNPGDAAGSEIEALCNQFGRTTNPDIKKSVTRMLATSYARYSFKAKTEMMRLYGLPEPMILDYLARTIDRRSLGARGGPRNQDEVWVRAARLLLSFPPSPAKAAGPLPGPTPLADSNPAARGAAPLVPAAAGRAQ